MTPRLATQLARQSGLVLAPSTVYRALRRAGLGTRQERLLVLEHHSASRAGLLTQRTRRTARASAAQPTAAPRRGQDPRRARLPGLSLRGKAQGRGQGLADHSLRCGLVLRHRVFVQPQPTAETAKTLAALDKLEIGHLGVVSVTDRSPQAVVELSAVEDDLVEVHRHDRAPWHEELPGVLDIHEKLIRKDLPDRAECLSAVGHEGLVPDLDRLSHVRSSDGRN